MAAGPGLLYVGVDLFVFCRPRAYKMHKYFMSVAVLTAKRSRDPNTQVGACIVKDGRIISVGYNHMPMGDDKQPGTKKFPDHKYLYVCNAVTHAILNAKETDLNGASVYTTLFPHNKCATNILVAGITKVFYIHDTYAKKNWCKASKKILEGRVQQMKECQVEITETQTDPFEG